MSPWAWPDPAVRNRSERRSGLYARTVPGCCYPDEYGRVFTPGEADRSARSYLRRGLTGTAADLADAVSAAGITGATVLEAGGGVGALTVELVRRGGGRGTVVDLSPTWDEAAARLAGAAGVSDRVRRVTGDVVVVGDDLDPAEVVVAHRVLCCYPDWMPLVDTLTRSSTRLVALTLPVDRPWTRLGIAVANRGLALAGRRFRLFVHPVGAVLARAASAGFRPVTDRSGLVWRTIVLERTRVSVA